MLTTEIAVEILVVGGGMVLAFIPLFSALFGVPTSHIVSSLNVQEMLEVLVALIYPLGLIWNRVCAMVLGGADARLRRRFFADDASYEDALVRIHMDSAAFNERMYQGQSLCRISRAYALTFLVAAVSVFVGIHQEPDAHISTAAAWGSSAFLLACAVLSFESWRHLRSSFLGWVVRSIEAAKVTRHGSD